MSDKGETEAPGSTATTDPAQPAQPKTRVRVYGSSVPGNRLVNEHQREIDRVFKTRGIAFEFIDVAADEEALRYMRRKNRGAKGLPQIFVDGEFKGLYEQFFEENECNTLKQWLGIN